VGPAGEILAACDAAHLVAGERHACGRGERLVRPGDGRKLLGSLTAFLSAAAKVGVIAITLAMPTNATPLASTCSAV
jgi:hypothetical protein